MYMNFGLEASNLKNCFYQSFSQARGLPAIAEGVRMKSLAVFALLPLLFSGCATIVTGGSDTLTFTSEPSGADVYLNGCKLGKTPLDYEAKRDAGGTVRFEMDGYKTAEMQTEKGFNYWVLGNVLLGGVPGMVVDFLASDMTVFRPTEYNAKLEREYSGRNDGERNNSRCNDSGRSDRYDDMPESRGRR